MSTMARIHALKRIKMILLDQTLGSLTRSAFIKEGLIEVLECVSDTSARRGYSKLVIGEIAAFAEGTLQLLTDSTARDLYRQGIKLGWRHEDLEQLTQTALTMLDCFGWARL